ncbi:hypothetical protein KY308_03730 [Candidatus Woesearchaeota archaeon]|nr:hypothetical protein [Candidatus Woesearchaeota archaeon]
MNQFTDISKWIKEYEMYKDIIEKSKFRDKIRFLKENPQLAFTNLANEGINPCCWGTAVYTVGGNRKIKQLWTENGHELDDYCCALGNYICIPDDSMPGYVGEEPMELFQASLVESDAAPDTIISFYWDNPNTELCGFRLRHSAICLGKHNGDEIIFHQLARGERFAICTLDQYKTGLSDRARKTLEARVYDPRDL